MSFGAQYQNSNSTPNTPEEKVKKKLWRAKIHYDPDQTELWLDSKTLENYLLKHVQKFIFPDFIISSKYPEVEEERKKIGFSFKPKIIFTKVEFPDKEVIFKKSFLFPFEFVHPIIQIGPWFFDWNNKSIVHPEYFGFKNLRIICNYTLDTTLSIDKIIKNVSEIVVKYNQMQYKEYSCNGYHFVVEMIEKGFEIVPFASIKFPKIIMEMMESTKDFGKFHVGRIPYISDLNHIKNHQDFDEYCLKIVRKKKGTIQREGLRGLDQGLWNQSKFFEKRRQMLYFQLKLFKEVSKITNFDFDKSDYFFDYLIMHFPKRGVEAVNSKNGSAIYLLIMEYLEYLEREIIIIDQKIIDFDAKACVFSAVTAPDLELLDLSDQSIDKIPKELKMFKKLCYMSMENNRIVELSTELFLLTDLITLNLQSNSIKELPKEFQNLKTLKMLNLSGNQIQDVSNLNNLNLETLNLADNKISNFSIELNYLKKLNLSGNGINDLKNSLLELRNLEELYLQKNQINEIPTEIKNLQYLIKLNLSNNKIVKITDEIKILTLLESFNLSCNRIEEIPSIFIKLKNLKKMNLEDNRIKSFPKDICQLISLETLILNNNFIDMIPPEIKNLKKLIVFEINENILNDIPKEITHLTKLKSLDLRNNKNLVLKFQQKFNSISDYQTLADTNGKNFHPCHTKGFCLGIESYTEMYKLSCCKNDAKKVHQILEKKGFDSQLKLDLSSRSIKEKITNLVDNLEKDNTDLLFFYYSGHGGEIDGINYIYGTDGASFEKIDLQSILIKPILKMKKKMITVVVLDACRTGSRNSTWKSEGESKDLKSFNIEGIKRKDQQFIFVYASDPGTTSSTSTSGMSIFTNEFVKHLPKQSSIQDIFVDTSNGIHHIKNIDQVPWINGRYHQQIHLE
eukprot:gene6923-11086_t